MNFLTAAAVAFFASFLVVPFFLLFLRLFGLYAIVRERRCLVYVLFGKVVGVLSIVGKAGQQFSAEDVALLASIADHVAVAVENAQLRQQAERAAVVEERGRLAREAGRATDEVRRELREEADLPPSEDSRDG